MTRPPEKSVPVSERDEQAAATMDEQPITIALREDMLIGTPVEVAAWRVGYRMGLARARHEGRLEERERVKQLCEKELQEVKDAMLAVAEGSMNYRLIGESGRTINFILRALALPEGETRT